MKKTQQDCIATDSTIEIPIDSTIYPLEAAMNAAYYFIEAYYVLFDRGAGGGILVRLRGKEKKTAAALHKTAGEFTNILLAETLRLELGKRNKKIRETILRQAISSTMSPTAPPEPTPEQAQQQELLELDEELKKILEKTKDMSFEEDPLGIGVPITDDTPAAPRKTPPRPGKKKRGASVKTDPPRPGKKKR